MNIKMNIWKMNRNEYKKVTFCYSIKKKKKKPVNYNRIDLVIVTEMFSDQSLVKIFVEEWKNEESEDGINKWRENACE